MTSQLVRLYVLVGAVLVFFTGWAAVAARPWKPTRPQDPRVAAIAARELRLRNESLRVKALVDRRWAAYRAALAARRAASTPAPAAPAPSVRVVTLPPLVVTRTS